MGLQFLTLTRLGSGYWTLCANVTPPTLIITQIFLNCFMNPQVIQSTMSFTCFSNLQSNFELRYSACRWQLVSFNSTALLARDLARRSNHQRQRKPVLKLNVMIDIYPLCFGKLLYKPKTHFNFDIDTLHYDRTLKKRLKSVLIDQYVLAGDPWGIHRLERLNAFYKLEMAC